MKWGGLRLCRLPPDFFSATYIIQIETKRHFKVCGYSLIVECRFC